MNVLLSREETYADSSPVRLDSKGISGLYQLCEVVTTCVLLCSSFYKRQREVEVHLLLLRRLKTYTKGYKSYFLGQNEYTDGILIKKEVIDPNIPTTNFSELLEKVALVAKDLRVRFSTSHLKT